jgi:hypothetical protein
MIGSKENSFSIKMRSLTLPPEGSQLLRTAGCLLSGGAARSVLAMRAARITSSVPLPRLRGIRDARSLNGYSDANAGIVDVPGHGSIIEAFAGEGGHAIEAWS